MKSIPQPPKAGRVIGMLEVRSSVETVGTLLPSEFFDKFCDWNQLGSLV